MENAAGSANGTQSSTSENPRRVRSVPAVILFLNGLSLKCIPPGVTFVDELPLKPTPGQHGRMIDEETCVDLTHLPEDLKIRNFIPVRALAVKRSNGYRFVLTFVQKKNMKPEDRPLTEYQLYNIGVLLGMFVHDTRLYRNFNQNGGNFVIDAGNRRLSSEWEANADLRVSPKTAEFLLVEHEEATKR